MGKMNEKIHPESAQLKKGAGTDALLQKNANILQ